MSTKPGDFTLDGAFISHTNIDIFSTVNSLHAASFIYVISIFDHECTDDWILMKFALSGLTECVKRTLGSSKPPS